MTPEKLKEIEAKAKELYPLGKADYLDSTKILDRAIIVCSQEAYTAGALSRQPELDTLQSENDRLRERQEYLEEVLAEYKCDYESLKMCVSKILTMTDNAEMIELINDTDFHLCANMK